jgi:hypothetical protein
MAMRMAGVGLGVQTPAEMEELVAASPSFDLGYPKIPGRDLEGVPNANDPVMRQKLRERLLRNPGGAEDLPGFLKKAEGLNGGSPIAMDLIYDGPREGDHSNMPVIPDAAAEEADREDLLREYRERLFPASQQPEPLLYS